MQDQELRTVRAVARAYGLSVAVWCGLSLLTGLQYRVFDKQRNIPSTFWDMLLLAESRGFSFALLTPPIFSLARRFMGAARYRFRYILGYCLGVGPFMLLTPASAGQFYGRGTQLYSNMCRDRRTGRWN